ncbi:hypothetical protein ACRAWG_37070 [Methylobacterium sp. P31]
MTEFAISEDCDGRWTVTAPGLVVGGLSREAAEAFVLACRRAQERELSEAAAARPAPSRGRDA